MEDRRWVNMSQPQTLQIAVFLLYINAVFGLLRGGVLFAAGMAAGGFGIANEKKWGYGLAVAIAVLQVVFMVMAGADDIFGRLFISFMFDVALVALLLHPQSRDYQRIWFK